MPLDLEQQDVSCRFGNFDSQVLSSHDSQKLSNNFYIELLTKTDERPRLLLSGSSLIQEYQAIQRYEQNFHHKASQNQVAGGGAAACVWQGELDDEPTNFKKQQNQASEFDGSKDSLDENTSSEKREAEQSANIQKNQSTEDGADRAQKNGDKKLVVIAAIFIVAAILATAPFLPHTIAATVIAVEIGIFLLGSIVYLTATLNATEPADPQEENLSKNLTSSPNEEPIQQQKPKIEQQPIFFQSPINQNSPHSSHQHDSENTPPTNHPIGNSATI